MPSAPFAKSTDWLASLIGQFLQLSSVGLMASDPTTPGGAFVKVPPALQQLVFQIEQAASALGMQIIPNKPVSLVIDNTNHAEAGPR